MWHQKTAGNGVQHQQWSNSSNTKSGRPATWRWAAQVYWWGGKAGLSGLIHGGTQTRNSQDINDLLLAPSVLWRSPDLSGCFGSKGRPTNFVPVVIMLCLLGVNDPQYLRYKIKKYDANTNLMKQNFHLLHKRNAEINYGSD